jgi:glycerol-3-phosphate acyltransferase PlsX
MLLGLKGLVIKSHGSADKYAFYVALERAYEAAKNHMVENIEKAFEPAQMSDTQMSDTKPVLESQVFATHVHPEIKS